MRTPRWRSDLISRGIHLLEVHEGFGEVIADMGHFDKVRIGYISLPEYHSIITTCYDCGYGTLR